MSRKYGRVYAPVAIVAVLAAVPAPAADYPAKPVRFVIGFPPGGSSVDVAQALASLKLLGEADLRAIDRDNAVRLFPRMNG